MRKIIGIDQNFSNIVINAEGELDLKNQYKIKMQAKHMAFNILRYLFFLSFSFVLLYPFTYIIINSLKSFSDTYDPTVTWVPKSIVFDNFAYAIQVFDFFENLKNTVLYAIVGALIQFCSCMVAAYGLARFQFKGRRLLSGIMILTILVPTMMIITPSYVNYSHMDFLGILNLIAKITGKDFRPNLIGTVWVFYLPSLLGVGLKGGLFIYIFTQFFKGLPKELEEAAWIDGAGPWKTFLNIVVPSSGSASITVLLFSIVWHWNDYYLAQMYNSDHPTLSVALNNFNTNTIANTLGMDMTAAIMLDVPILLAGCLMYILPMIIFYCIIQRRFIQSIATSGIVG